MHTRWLIRGVMVVGLLGIAVGRSAAAPVPITNPGFEADFAADNTFPLLTPTGWSPYDPGGILNGGGNSIGVLNPTSSTFFPAGAPEGSNVALIFLSNTIGGPPAGIRQTLGTPLSAGTIYTLSMDVGNIASGIGAPPFDQFGFFDLDGFPGYRVELRAGGALVAEDDDTLRPAEGTFERTRIRAVVGATHPGLDQPLEIRLINLNREDTPADPGIEVDFDDLRLDATPIDAAAGSAFVACLGGPGQPPTCPADQAFIFDFDQDGDVDLADYAAMTAVE